MRHDYIRHHLTVHLATVFHKLTDRQTDGQTNNPTDGHYPRYEFTACDSSVTSVQVKVLCMFFPKFTTPLQHHKTQGSLHITSPLATSLILTEQQNCTVNCSSILLQQTKSCYQPLLTPELQMHIKWQVSTDQQQHVSIHLFVMRVAVSERPQVSFLDIYLFY